MFCLLAAFLPPLGLLLNGQPFSAIFNLVLLVFCLVFGLIFHVLLLVPSAHALIAVHMKPEDRRHRGWWRRSASTARRRDFSVKGLFRRAFREKPVHSSQTL